MAFKKDNLTGAGCSRQSQPVVEQIQAAGTINLDGILCRDDWESSSTLLNLLAQRAKRVQRGYDAKC